MKGEKEKKKRLVPFFESVGGTRGSKFSYSPHNGEKKITEPWGGRGRGRTAHGSLGNQAQKESAITARLTMEENGKPFVGEPRRTKKSKKVSMSWGVGNRSKIQRGASHPKVN